jgi:hypothetical protein
VPDHDVIHLAESYLAFLDHEIALRQDLRGNPQAHEA